MDILQLVEVLWKRKWIIAVGAFLGLILTFRALYTFEIGLGYPRLFKLEPRSFTVYQTSINLMLDEPGFGLGRLGLGKEGAGFDRLTNLAVTYSYIMASDAVSKQVREELGPVSPRLKATPVQYSPVITVTVEGTDSKAIQKFAQTTVDVFINYMKAEQTKNNIPKEDRILLRKLGPPSTPTQTSSRKMEIAFLMFMAPLIGSAALSFILENFDKSTVYRRKRRLIVEPAKSNPKNA